MECTAVVRLSGEVSTKARATRRVFVTLRSQDVRADVSNEEPIVVLGEDRVHVPRLAARLLFATKVEGLRFIQEGDAVTSQSKIALARAVSVVISAGLGILGVEPAQEMR